MSEYEAESMASWAHPDPLDLSAAAAVDRMFTEFDDMLYAEGVVSGAPTAVEEAAHWRGRCARCNSY